MGFTIKFITFVFLDAVKILFPKFSIMKRLVYSLILILVAAMASNGIKIDVPQPNKIIISGIDKERIGQYAAEIREKRRPEPYKGKGIKYSDEHIRRKVGKTGKK